MNKRFFTRLLAAATLCTCGAAALPAKPAYKNFKVSVYVRAYEAKRTIACAADARNMSTAWATPSRYKWPAPIWRRSNWTSHSWTDPGFSQPNGQEI